MSLRVQQAKDGDQQGLEALALQRWFNSEFLAVHPDVERQITARLQKNDPARFLECYELLSKAEDHHLDYGSFAMPTLIITGDGDPGSTPRMAQEMALAMPKAQTEIVQGAKHLGIIEHHRRFSGPVKIFLTEWGL